MIPEKDFACRQILGARERQEDTFSFSDIHGKDGQTEGLLVLVADGMGGHNSGERASELAMKSFVESFHAHPGSIRERLLTSMTKANTALAMELKHSPELKGMGTTLVAATITLEGVHWISVGDSLLYLLRKGNLKRLNADHSFRPYLREMIETGKLTPEKAAKHPFRNLLQSAVMGDEIELIDAPENPLDLQDGDLLVAASDGLQTLSDEEIVRVLTRSPATEATRPAAELVVAVQEAGKPKQDNVTVALILFTLESLSTRPVSATVRSDSITKVNSKKKARQRT